MPAFSEQSARGAHVLVTGATGYVAGWLVKRLLDTGAVVHATVRDPSDEQKIAHLKAMAESTTGKLIFFKANLLEDGSFDEAMRDCSIVFHTASPFLAAGKIVDPQRDLVDPALKGTTTVLDSVNRTASVTRVVLTSSVAAMSGGPADIEKAPGGVLTEASWNTVSTLDMGPYLYSKTVAERRAWEMAEAQERWSLVVINPGLVLGPGASATQTSASFDFIRNLSDGTFRAGAPPMMLGMVDVQDVAEAHFRAAFDPDASGRHIISQDVYAMDDLAEILKSQAGPGWSFPETRTIPADAPLPRWDNSKSRHALGLNYAPIEPAAIAMFQQLTESGQLARPQ